MGWSSVWGSGSAWIDYLIPIPVAGGALHVPSFVVGGLIVWNMPSANAKTVGSLRALLFGTALAGLLLLLRLEDLLLALQTHSSRPGTMWQENPLGLFVLSDALVALVFTAAANQGPWLRAEFATVMLLLLPPAIPVGMVFKYSSGSEPFRQVASRQGPTRSDEIILVYTHLNVGAPDFHARAEAWAAPLHPRLSINSDDVAILFTHNLDAARNFDATQVSTTLCLYEDGTQPLWAPGAGLEDCFDGHESFSERFSRAYAERPPVEPPDLKDYMARAGICTDVKPIPAGGETGGIELSSMRICRGLPETRAQLRLRYPQTAALQDAPV